MTLFLLVITSFQPLLKYFVFCHSRETDHWDTNQTGVFYRGGYDSPDIGQVGPASNRVCTRVLDHPCMTNGSHQVDQSIRMEVYDLSEEVVPCYHSNHHNHRLCIHGILHPCTDGDLVFRSYHRMFVYVCRVNLGNPSRPGTLHLCCTDEGL